MPAKMTSTAWERGFKNMLICGVGVLVGYAVVMTVLVMIFHETAGDAFGISASALGYFFLVGFLVAWIYGRATTGPVLLDCGPHPTRWLFLAMAVIHMFMALNGWYSGKSSATGFGASGPVFLALFATFWLVMATGRLQIRENGIWQYWSLLRWGGIDSYEWAEDATLLLKAKGVLALLQGALPVPPEHRQAVADLLAKHCSVLPTAEAAAERSGE